MTAPETFGVRPHEHAPRRRTPPAASTSTSASPAPAGSCQRALEERFGPILQLQEPLAHHTTMRVGGAARYFLMPRNAREAGEVLAALHHLGVPVFLLGGGSNLLVKDDGFDGAVVNLSALRAMAKDKGLVRVGAGTPLALVCKQAMRAALTGMEPLVGIPGTLGGAVAMNAGGRHGELSDVIESVVVVDGRGQRTTLTRDQVGFGYRRSDLRGRYALEATLRLTRGTQQAICDRMVELLRAKSQSQPLGARSAGCVFKNPAPGRAAAMLIDRAGLKGLAEGGARVSPRHANFIVNERQARAQDVLALVAKVRREILLRHGTPLALEMQVLGPRGLEAH